MLPPKPNRIATEELLEVLVNGERQRVLHGTTPADLLSQFPGRRSPRAVELNGAIVSASQLNRPLQAGDQLEIVTLVGGG